MNPVGYITSETRTLMKEIILLIKDLAATALERNKLQKQLFIAQAELVELKKLLN